MNNFRQYLLTFFILATGSILCAQGIVVRGSVQDATDDSPLPFTSIALMNSGAGTTSNQEGTFSINIVEAQFSDSLAFSYIGYDTYTIAVSDVSGLLTIRLVPSANVLDEVIIRPMSPEDYLKSVIVKVAINQADEPFNTKAYYREEIRENGEYIRHSEGVFVSHHDSFQAKSKADHQLVLFRENKDTKQLEFMADKARKEKEKHLEENPEDSAKFAEEELFLANFGGPSVVIGIQVGNKSISFLDSLSFRHYRYSFGPETSFSGREMITIEFESKGTVEHSRNTGIIYIDKESDAVVAMRWKGKIIIPVWVRPILFAMGMSIDPPVYEAEARFQEKDGRWYPQQVRMDMDISLTKKHLFKKNQHGTFEIVQLYVINELVRENTYDIPKSVKYNPNEPIKEQLYWDGASKWSQVNVVD